MIEHQVEINAPASIVRQVCLDFPNLSSWHTEFLTSVQVLTPGKTTGEELVVGDKMKTTIPGMEFSQTILSNSPTELKWVGPWYGLLTGTHAYLFLPDETDPEKSTFKQWESFTGILSPFMSYENWFGGKKTLAAFKGVDADLKKEAERVWREMQGKGAVA